MFLLFESIKIIDGKPQNLSFHQNRINKSLKNIYKWNENFNLEKIINPPEEYSTGIVKCRFKYSSDNYNIEYEHYSIRKINSLKLITCNNIIYNHKYTDRQQLNKCLEHKGSCDDILIVKNSNITDTSFTNIVFWNGENWTTPKTFLLNGTCRQRLLSNKKIILNNININNLNKYKGFKLINAMIDLNDTKMLPISNIIL